MNGLNLTNIKTAMLGSTQVRALYYGSLKLWEYILLSDAWYLGSATKEQIQDQNYINGLVSTQNQNGKPTSFNVTSGYNVLIVPSSWGTPNIYGDAEYNFGVTPYYPEDLGIENPTGYILLVAKCNDPEGSTFYIKEWN